MASLPQPIARKIPLPVPSSRRLPRTLLAGLALLIVVAVGLLQVLQTSRATTVGYELRALEQERAQLAAEVRLLEADIAQQARVEQVRETAIQRLGMVTPTATVRVQVDTPAPSSIALPERYVVRPQPVEPPSLALWEQLLRKLPGFN